jgi:hypothetical protein
MESRRNVVQEKSYGEIESKVNSDVRKQADEWFKKELPKRMTSTGRDEEDIRKELEAEAVTIPTGELC